jgi:hypothetical protein
MEALRCKSEGRGLEAQWIEWHLSIYLILPAAPGPGLYSASNRNQYQKQKCDNSVCSVARPVREAYNLTVWDPEQPNRHPRHVTVITLVFLYVDDVRTS